MGYVKVITYSNFVETYEYEKALSVNVGRRRGVATQLQSGDIRRCGSVTDVSAEQEKVREKANARRSVLAFKRLVTANLGGCEIPIFITLTYKENQTDLRQARKDFNSFTTYVQSRYGKQIRFVCVPEFQKRGAVHFHALFWGLSAETFRDERTTRLVATIWQKGFVFMKMTDNSPKLANYLGKYMSKAYLDKRLFGMKAYSCSRNIKRPQIAQIGLVWPILQEYELSTDSACKDVRYSTKWLGACRRRIYKIEK